MDLRPGIALGPGFEGNVLADMVVLALAVDGARLPPAIPVLFARPRPFLASASLLDTDVPATSFNANVAKPEELFLSRLGSTVL